MQTGQAPDWQAKFLDLWPTILIRREIDGYEKPNARLTELIEEMDRVSEQLTTHYQGVDFLGTEESGVRWLRAAIEATVAAYFRQSGMEYPIRWSLQSWPNVNRRGDYHAPHNHAWCYLSGTYYVKLPADGGGAISFYDPRAGVNMLVPGGEGHEYTIKPGPGTLLLWHSSVNHLVHPNLSDEPRISISFNVVLEWANHYASDA
ncbi:MAG: hypothetical protein E4H01_16140 [Lysobacterales bacterium]|nr:MAG: hypothetical protein E4H01_16140 [Xanthomonadales bacterium]